MNKLNNAHIEGFNKRCLTETDFFAVCDRENIKVIEADVPTSFYFKCGGMSFIVIKKSLKGLKRLFEMFHELSHHFFHCGRDSADAFFFGLHESKNEVEADAFATIALVPRHALSTYDFLEEHPNRYARQLFKNRQKLDFLYQI